MNHRVYISLNVVMYKMLKYLSDCRFQFT